MDPLAVFESACKSVRSVKRGVGAYLGELRKVYVGALDDVAEQARQHLLAVEEAEEVWPGRGCGNDAGDGAEQSSGAQVGNPPRDQDLCAAKCPGRSCWCTKAADHVDEHGYTDIFWTNVSASPSGAPTAGDDPVGVSDGIPPLSPPTGTPSELVLALPDEVLDVLAEHLPCRDYTGIYCNDSSLDGPHAFCHDWQAWREHVSGNIDDRAAADRRVADRLDAVPEKFQRWFQK